MLCHNICRYEHYDETGNATRSQSRKNRSQDPFSDKYFDIMDRVQELNLVRGAILFKIAFVTIRNAPLLRAGKFSCSCPFTQRDIDPFPILQKAESLVGEKNRALRAAMNAELRKEKALLLDELPELEKLIRVGAGGGKKGGVPQEVFEEREEQFNEAIKAVEDVPDGLPGGISLRPQRTGSQSFTNGGGGSYSGRVVLDPSKLDSAMQNTSAYEHTAETAEFVRDASIAKDRQDLALDNIERGISTLKELGAAMSDEIERHDVIIDEVDAKMDTVTKEIQNNNQRLKGLVTSVRSSRRFFIDLILICVLLALGLYIFNMVKQKLHMLRIYLGVCPFIQKVIS